VGHTADMKNAVFGLFSLVLSSWVQVKVSRGVLPLTSHQRSMHCESSRVANGAEIAEIGRAPADHSWH